MVYKPEQSWSFISSPSTETSFITSSSTLFSTTNHQPNNHIQNEGRLHPWSSVHCPEGRIHPWSSVQRSEGRLHPWSSVHRSEGRLYSRPSVHCPEGWLHPRPSMHRILNESVDSTELHGLDSLRISHSSLHLNFSSIDTRYTS